MNGHSISSIHNDSRGIQTRKNGVSNLNMGGIDNPAYRRSESSTVLSQDTTEDFATNQVVYRHLQDDEQGMDNWNNIYGSSNNTWDFMRMREPTTPYEHNGLTMRSSRPRTAQVLGRPSAQLTISRRHPMGTTSARAYSRQKSSTDMRAFISHFDIETDKLSSHQYRPGEEITGTVVLLVRKSFQIRFFELIATGQGQVRMKKTGDRLPQKCRETYLHKEKCIIGNRVKQISSLLTPGHYSSKFRVKLPTDLPSTFHHEDPVNEFTFDVTYALRVRLCDNSVPAPSRHTAASDSVVRVILEKQINFNVQRGFDLVSIPDAMSPITHTEQVYLACNHQQAAIVSVRLERAVFLAGDDMRLQMELSLPSTQTVKEITCKLQQLITLKPKQEPIALTLCKLTRKDPCNNGTKTTNQKVEKSHLEITIPTNITMLSPYSLGNSKIKLEYCLTADIRFVPAGGKLSFKVPVGIGPCAEPIYAEKNVFKKVLPLFNRATRFPFFTSRVPNGSSPPKPSTQKGAASVQVVTSYSNGLLARCLLCCIGSGNT